MPQQYVAWSTVTPHACEVPTDTDANWNPPATGKGTRLLHDVGLVKVSQLADGAFGFPNWSYPFQPQQYSALEVVTPHVVRSVGVSRLVVVLSPRFPAIRFPPRSWWGLAGAHLGRSGRCR